MKKLVSEQVSVEETNVVKSEKFIEDYETLFERIFKWNAYK